MELGEMVSRYRKDAGMTIDELSAASGVPKGTLNKIIAGTTKSPTLDTVRALADALGKKLEDFDDGLQKKQPAPTNEGGLSEEDKRIIELLHQLTPENRERIVEIIKALASQ
mgnify:CR=1 FL=1